MMPPNNAQTISRWRQWRSRLHRGNRWLVQLMAGHVTRLIVIAIAFLGVGWLLYINVWQPLGQAVGLPPGVTERNPKLEVNILRTIGQQRSDRTQHQAAAFSIADRIFGFVSQREAQ